jgi:hypothetical protein
LERRLESGLDWFLLVYSIGFGGEVRGERSGGEGKGPKMKGLFKEKKRTIAELLRVTRELLLSLSAARDPKREEKMVDLGKNIRDMKVAGGMRAADAGDLPRGCDAFVDTMLA